MNLFSIVAETRDGQSAKVPSSYFKSHSFNFVAPWHVNIGEEFFPTRVMGQTVNEAQFRRAMACEDSNEALAAPLVFSEEARSFIYAHHQRVLAAGRKTIGGRGWRSPAS